MCVAARFRQCSCAMGFVLLMAVGLGFAEEPKVSWGQDITAEKPKIWQDANGKDILAAEEVARTDAFRKMLGRIYGLKVQADVDVLDMVLDDAKVESDVAGVLKGMKEIEWRYSEDGRCEVAVQVTIREIVEVITEHLKRGPSEDKKKVIEELTTKIETEVKDKNLVEVGSGALKGSLGLKKIRARRAAELDAYRKLAERIGGLYIDSQTRVADFVLANDRVLTRTAYFFKGIRFSDARYTDKVAEVDAELTIRQLVEFLKETQKREFKEGKWSEMRFISKDIQNEDTVLGVTGKGAISDEMATTRPAAQEGTLAEEKEIIKTVITKRVLRQEIGAE